MSRAGGTKRLGLPDGHIFFPPNEGMKDDEYLVLFFIFVKTNIVAMRRILLSLAILLFSSMTALGQYANYQNTDVTSTKEYKIAKTAYYSGITVAVVGAGFWICGNVICIIEQNNYTNIRSTSGSIEEIQKLNQEAKQQPAYKKGEAMEIGGFAGMLAGAGVAWLGRHKMNKLKNASGQTVATIEYAPTPVGLALALNF